MAKPKQKSPPAGLVVSDLYLRRTSDGSVVYTHHRVWDGEKFAMSEAKAAKEAGGRVEIATAAEYRQHQRSKK